MLDDIICKYNKYDIGFYAEDKYENKLEYNSNKLFETASCCKVFILIEYYKQVFLKKIKWDNIFEYNKEDNIIGKNSGVIKDFTYGIKLRTEDLATLMILYSDNIATNKLIDYLGLENINETIKQLGLKNTKILHKLDLLKYKKFGVTTPKEYASIFKMILQGKAYNKWVSKKVLNLLKKQTRSDMINKGLPQYDLLFKGNKNESIINYVASKSGSVVYIGTDMKNCRNDGGVIATKYGNYIISIFVSDLDDLQLNYDNKGINCGAEISKYIFNKFISNKGSLKWLNIVMK